MKTSKHAFLAAIAAAFTCLTFTNGALCARADSNPYSVQYTVNGYAGTEVLTNFPVLVRLAADSPVAFSYADCAAGGADLTFTDDAGNVIPREIDTWTTNGESLVWVCVPVVTNGASFTMHYGDTYVAAQPACQTDGSVWSGANFKGVWHMDSVDPADSSPNGFDGRKQTTNLSVVDGPLGAAVNFPRTTTGDGITCGEVLPNSQLTGGFTIEGWCRPTQYGGMGDGAAMFGKEGFVSLRINSATKVILTTPNKTNHDIVLDSGVLPDVNTWWHFVATFKMNTANTGLHFYVNGQLVKTLTSNDIQKKTETTEMFIGNNQWSQAFKGDLDEIRLSAGIRSTNWVAASYATQHAADFLAAGPRQGGEAPFLAHATATPGYTDAQLSTRLVLVGAGATSASVSFAYGPEGGALSAPVVLAANATGGETLSTNLTGLAAGTTYRYVFTAENDLPVPLSSTEEGTFSTFALSAPTLSLSDRQESKESQTVGASVTDLGGGASCDLYFAYGPNGAPLSYSQVGTDLAAGATFSRLLEDLDVGTVYAYSFAVTNDLGLGTVQTGTFTAGAGWLNPARFAYRATFTVTGYTGTEVLENFPALVRLAADSPTAFAYADCAAGGADIRFADAEGRLIPHEIETWDTTGESLLWVGLPIATNGTTFTMYYRSDAPGAPSTDDVWANYVAVIHGGSTIANAVAGGPTTTAGSAAVTASAAAGKVGGGINKSSNSSIGLNVAMPSAKLSNNGKFSVSAWFKRDGNGGKNNGTHVLGGSQTTWNTPGFLWLQEQGKYISVAAPGSHQWSSGSALPDGEWAHAAFAYEKGVSLVGYLNGAAYQTKSGPGDLVNATGGWTFGSYANAASDDSFKGDMDEIRIYNGVASDDRIKAEYDTMASGAFLTAGPSSASGKPQLSTSSLLVDLDAVNVSATIDFVGSDASSCDLYFAYAPAGDALPDWTLVASGLGNGASRTRNLTGLVEDADYGYAFMASNNLGRTIVRSGTFMTGIGFKRPDKSVAEFSRGVKFTVSGYTGTQELTNFPVLVRLSNNSPAGFSYADFYNPGDVQGADLCFLDAAGNGIPHEIDTWNPSGESLVWVTLPRMVNGTEFSMWYRSSKSGSVICADNAWEDYTGVWHLGEGGDGAQYVYDSTTNTLTGVTHANSLAVSEGRIGSARRNSTVTGNSANNGRILVDLSDSAKRAAVDALAAEDSDKTFTASLWMRPRSGTDYCYMISRKEDDYYSSWGVQYNNNNTQYFTKMRVYSSETHYNQCKEFDVESTAKDTWRKIDIVWSGPTYTVYYNGGAKTYSGTLYNSQGAANGSSDLSFGGCTAAGYGSFNGELDEIRLRKGANSADWVKAEYDAVVDAAFLSGGEVVVLAETPRPIATLGLSDSSARYAQFSGSIGLCGGDATACDVLVKVWKSAESEPAEWTILAPALAEGAAFTKAVTGLDPETPYSWKLKAVNNLETPTDSEIAEGSFTTGGTGAGGTGGERMRIGNDYVHIFEIDPETGVNTYEFTPPSYASSIEALVVAGGGPGGYRRGGGGGAGGLIHDTALAVAGGSTYTVTVGAGGVASESATAYGTSGGASSIALGQTVLVETVGGGAGGNADNASYRPGAAGGSGGGGGGIAGTAGGAGTAGQGNAGGQGNANNNNSVAGGGGGAGRAGGSGSGDSPPSAGSGGQGYRCAITGSDVWYAGGGGGGGVQVGNANNLGSPGGGGDGGGGRGGMAVPSGTVNPAFDEQAVAGTDGLGGGGGGGSDVSGSYKGANGGNGIVIVRYTVQGSGAGSAEPVVSLTGATYAGDLKITGTWRVAWAGEGANDADVYIKWGYAANSLTHSVNVAQDAVGTGTFEITVPVDQKTIYLRAMADNGSAQGLSDEIVPIYVPEYSGVVPGDQTIPVLDTVSLSVVDGVFARVSGTVTSFGTAGEGEDPITGCEVYALVGTSDNVSRMTEQDPMPVAAGEPFSLAISNLTSGVTYYWCLEARNSAGVAIATEVGSFTTLGASAMNGVTTGANQRNVSVSGSLSQVGAGTTTILARWNDGGWSVWEPVATFVSGAASTAFTATHLASGWSNVGWEIMCSNECATAEGVPTGQAWTSTLSGTVSPEDKAVYTWQPVDGDWNGAWNDSAHWSCSFEDGRGYPQMGTATASFANCTLANPVTVSVPTAHTIGTLRFFGENPVSLTFVGQGASTSRITATTLQENAAKSDSVLEFRDMTVGRVNDNFWTVAPTDSSTTNLTLRFSGTTLQNVSSFVFAAPYSTVEFLNGSTATFSSKMSIGGTNTVVTIDDSVVNAKSIYIPADADGPGMKVRLCGTTPLLKQNTTDGAFTCWAQSWPMVYEFQVPVGGYTAAPIQMVSTSYKFGQANTSDTSGATPTLSFSVANDSPALRTSGTILNNVLVQTASGFQIDRMANPIGTVPRNGTIKYGLNGAETSDTDAARQILLDLTGRSPLTMILVW